MLVTLGHYTHQKINVLCWDYQGLFFSIWNHHTHWGWTTWEIYYLMALLCVINEKSIMVIEAEQIVIKWRLQVLMEFRPVFIHWSKALMLLPHQCAVNMYCSSVESNFELTAVIFVTVGIFTQLSHICVFVCGIHYLCDHFKTQWVYLFG